MSKKGKYLIAFLLLLLALIPVLTTLNHSVTPAHADDVCAGDTSSCDTAAQEAHRQAWLKCMDFRMNKEYSLGINVTNWVTGTGQSISFAEDMVHFLWKGIRAPVNATKRFYDVWQVKNAFEKVNDANAKLLEIENSGGDTTVAETEVQSALDNALALNTQKNVFSKEVIDEIVTWSTSAAKAPALKLPAEAITKKLPGVKVLFLAGIGTVAVILLSSSISCAFTASQLRDPNTGCSLDDAVDSPNCVAEVPDQNSDTSDPQQQASVPSDVQAEDATPTDAQLQASAPSDVQSEDATPTDAQPAENT